MTNLEERRKEIEKILEHEPYYPVVGGLAECAKCGKQAFEDNETCRINFIIVDILSLISKIEQEAREDENKECREILIKNVLKSKGESKK